VAAVGGKTAHDHDASNTDRTLAHGHLRTSSQHLFPVQVQVQVHKAGAKGYDTPLSLMVHTDHDDDGAAGAGAAQLTKGDAAV